MKTIKSNLGFLPGLQWRLRAIPLALALSLGLLTNAHAVLIQWDTASGGNGHYYEYVDIAVSWDEANAVASSSEYMGITGHLATITSAAENDFIITNLGFSSAGFPLDSPWLGGFQAAGSGEPAGGWQWVTGEAFSYTNWAIFEPNNSFGTEDVLQMAPSGLWNDNTGTNFFSYIVEYSSVPAVPLPPAIVLLTSGLFGLWEIRRRSGIARRRLSN